MCSQNERVGRAGAVDKLYPGDHSAVSLVDGLQYDRDRRAESDGSARRVGRNDYEKPWVRAQVNRPANA